MKYESFRVHSSGEIIFLESYENLQTTEYFYFVPAYCTLYIETHRDLKTEKWCTKICGYILGVTRAKIDRVKDTDFGDIFDLSPIAVLFTQILFEGVSYRYLQQNCFSIYLNCNQNLCLSFQQYMLYVSYRFW